MSGSKRITVDQDVWQQAQAAAERLRDVNRELPGMLDALRRDQQARVEQVSAQMQARQEELTRSLAGLSEQTRKLEAETSRRLRAKATAIWAETQTAVEEVRAQSRRALEEQEERLSADLARERKERQAESQELRATLAGMTADRERAATAAQTLLADARLLNDTIDRGLPHERYAPGRLAALADRLAFAEGNLAQGHGEAALAQAQNLYVELDQLRVEVELRDQEWQAAQLAAVSAVTMLTEQIKVNSMLEVTDEEGAQLGGVTLDVDFWSEGELAELQAEADALAGCVASADPPPSLAELHAIVQREIPGMDERLTAIITRARARQLASQVRVNLAELVVNTLEESTGYAWEEGQALYANGDERRAFYSKLRHPDDSEIVVEVAPDDIGESCVLRIMSYDAGVPDEEERVRRAHTITDRLRERGLRVGMPAADREPPDPALTDFDRLREPVTVRRSAVPIRTERRLGQERG